MSDNWHKPQFLFRTLDSLINPCYPNDIVPSLALCDKFFYISKVSVMRPSVVSSASPVCLVVFDSFELVLFSSFCEIVQNMLPSVVDLINSSLMSGCVHSP